MKILTAFVTSQHDDKHPAFEGITSHLSKFVEVLAKNEMMRDSSIGPVLSCGVQNIAIVEFITSLVNIQAPSLNKTISDCGLLNGCISMFFNIPLNNFLHTSVLKLIENLLGGSDQEIKISLLKSDFPERVVFATRKAKEKNEKGVVTGYYANGGCVINRFLHSNNTRTPHIIITLV